MFDLFLTYCWGGSQNLYLTWFWAILTFLGISGSGRAPKSQDPDSTPDPNV